MKKLRVGVVGVGHIGSNHARIYAELPHAEFVAVFDIDSARAAEIAAKYKTKAVESLNQFAEMVDAASVATPTNAHFSVARDLLARGKHLLIEKPITENTADARELAQAAAEKRLVLQVGHVERFNPVLSALEQRLTHPRFIEAHRLSPYPNRSTEIGVVLDLMIHDLEIILHLVSSTGGNYRRGRRAGPESRRRHCQCSITFRQTAASPTLLPVGISPERMRKIRVFQEDAYLSLDYQGQSGEIYRRVNGQITRDPVPIEKEEPLRQQLASFVDCALTGGEPKVSGSHAAAALELAVEITKRIATT